MFLWMPKCRFFSAHSLHKNPFCSHFMNKAHCLDVHLLELALYWFPLLLWGTLGSIFNQNMPVCWGTLFFLCDIVNIRNHQRRVEKKNNELVGGQNHNGSHYPAGGEVSWATLISRLTVKSGVYSFRQRNRSKAVNMFNQSKSMTFLTVFTCVRFSTFHTTGQKKNHVKSVTFKSLCFFILVKIAHSTVCV